MHCNGVWGAKRPKHHYPNHYFAALPFSIAILIELGSLEGLERCPRRGHRSKPF
jgi:hypothetical protein